MNSEMLIICICFDATMIFNIYGPLAVSDSLFAVLVSVLMKTTERDEKNFI